jgi:hypothetical protein
LIPPRHHAPRPERGLVARLYVYAFLGDFILLYPLYAVLFARTGLSTRDLVALRDLVDHRPRGGGPLRGVGRRRVAALLLALAPCLGAVGFGLWTVAPSYPAFAAGFVLWGMQGALQSGALEALVYEELDRVGAAPRFAEVMGRATAGGTVASAAAIGLAAPVQSAGGFSGRWAASVLACLAGAAIGLGFPEHRAPAAGAEDAAAARAPGRRRAPADRRPARGLGSCGPDRRVRARSCSSPRSGRCGDRWTSTRRSWRLEAGASVGAVPLLFLVVYAGVAAGGLLGGVAARLRPAGLARRSRCGGALAGGRPGRDPLGLRPPRGGVLRLPGGEHRRRGAPAGRHHRGRHGPR